MRIKKLELMGFKSFKDRTVIQFDSGITGIVGPNGCGKSNIVDALMWVMGEMSAKDLRGSTMTDVIFAGAEGFAPMGLCEVSLTLENDGGPFPAKYLRHSEIMVTRRLHRNGEGEYFVNKESARLKDVQEIFMDTGAGSKGFSIIAQGMIGRIITAKPEDRRMLIEEAAGITKFKVRKKESQRKLQATDQNLVRLQDIIGELKRQIDSLHRQAQRAERYRALKQQIEDLDLWISSAQYVDIRKTLEESQRIFDEAQNLEIEGESQWSSLQGQWEVLKLQLLEKEKESEELQSQFYSHQNFTQKQEMEIQNLKFEIEQARRNEQLTGNNLQEQQARQEILLRDRERLQEQCEELLSEIEGLQGQFQSQNQNYQISQGRIQSVDEELTIKRRDLFALGQSESSLEARVSSLTGHIADLEDRMEQESLVLNELKEKQVQFGDRKEKVLAELEELRSTQRIFQEKLEALDLQKKNLQEKIFEKKSESDEYKDQLNQVTSRLYGLEDLQSSFEGFQEGVKQVMLWQKAKVNEVYADGSQGFSFQPVSEVVEVPAEYEMAMEAALGARLQILLSEDSHWALEAVDHLKNQKLGRSSFLFESENQKKLNSKSGDPGSEEGCLGKLKDVVKASPRFESALQSLLGGVALVDSLKTALRLRPLYEGWTFVTLEGDTLNAEGVLTGGAAESADSGVLKRRREIKDLSSRKEELAGKWALIQSYLQKLENEWSEVSKDWEAAQKAQREQDIRLAEVRKDVERAENESHNVEVAVQKQEREVLRLQEQADTQRSKQEEMNENLFQAKEKKTLLDREVADLQSELGESRDGFESLQMEVADLRAQLASKTQENQGLQRQREMVEKSLRDLEAQLQRMTEEAEGYSHQMTESQFTLEEKKIEFEHSVNELENLRVQLAKSQDEYEVLSGTISEMEGHLSQYQKSKNERQNRMTESQLKLEQSRMKEQYLLDQIRERYMVYLPDVVEKYAHKEGDFLQADKELKEHKEKISKMGEVNLSAIEEYQETSQRYEFLSQQYKDLMDAKEQLRRVIDRINRICSKRFKETFDLVNERFVRVFPVLFGGGEARLELIEDPEKGEMGIEIIAKPPGKKMQNVSLMSGGEKALTAVALVFSIFLVKPSPYCLLDEVDAPLDDANVFRFNDLVREMSKRSQIIVVTHNKHTMEVANKLYGVTMQDRGVSTMVSVNLGDIKDSHTM